MKIFTRNYATEILYSPLGGMTKEKFGTDTPLYNKSFYNSRGQLSEIRVGTTYTGPTDSGWQRGAIINHYSSQCWGACNGSDNNGNLKQQDHWIPDGSGGVQGVFVQNYTYDSLNRLQRVVEGSWQQEFVYDRWGNRTIHQTNSWGTGINKKPFDVDPNTNRLNVPAGQSGTMSYDAVGNLTNDTYTGAGNRTYDAENKITSAWGGNNQAQLYAYDANGQRIKRTVDGVETWQVYGFGGELLAEYPANGAAAAPQKEYGYRNGQLLITAEPSTNVATAANGATVSASSTLSSPPFTYPVGAVNNGDRKGVNAGFGGNWHSSSTALPQWVQVDFSGNKTISEVNVFSLQDNYSSPSEPTEATTFSLYGLTGFEVQYWNGSAWTTVPGGSVTGNNKVWKKVSFAPLTTSKIRVLINATADGWSRMVEVEAWTTGSSNVKWLVADHLGTPRMIIDQTGTLANIKRHDYLPFGEELYAGSGGRSTALGYSGGDGVRQQFTSKERDVETGLDFFGARYYSSSQGRFTSPDPFSIIQMRQSGRNDAKTHSAFMQFIGDPRRWNRSAYAINSPLVFTDKTGLDIMIIENRSTEGNPIGHTAIAVTGRGVFSMGNGETTTRSDHKDKKNNIIGGGVADYLNRESPRRDTIIFVVKTTAEQDAAVVKSMVEQAQSKRDISQEKKTFLLVDNCSTRVNEALDKAGGELVLTIDTPPANVPGSAGSRALLSGLPVTTITMPQGTKVSDLKDTEKKIIENFEPPDRPMRAPDE